MSKTRILKFAGGAVLAVIAIDLIVTVATLAIGASWLRR